MIVAAVLVLSGCSGSSGAASDGAASQQAVTTTGPAVGDCLKMAVVKDLTRLRRVDCARPHEGQVFALIGLPASIADPAVPRQVTAARPSLNCPDVRHWAGYTGTVPLGLFRTWRFPTKQQIAAGAHWAACVAILAPGPDHNSLRATVGSLRGKLAGNATPLPLLGQCAAAHTNAVFTPITCVPGSKQWVWLGAHRKPTGAYPGRAKAKQAADQGCLRLVTTQGPGAAFVYYPRTSAAWGRTRADWSCWMPLANVKA